MTPGIVGAVEFSLRALFSSHLSLKSGADGNQVSFSPLPASDPGQSHEPKKKREISAKLPRKIAPENLFDSYINEIVKK